MADVYVVRAVPLRTGDGEILGWVRVDVLSDGSKPTDKVFLRDGSMHDQAKAITEIARDRSLLYPTEEDAVRDGIARLRAANKLGLTRPMARPAP